MTDNASGSDSVERQPLDDYSTYLAEPSRPPRRGGNTAALHRHVVTIGGQRYSFLALGAKKWAFKNDVVSFRFRSAGAYLNILKESFRAFDRLGNEVVRGDRGWKPTLRTALARLPASRREQRD